MSSSISVTSRMIPYGDGVVYVRSNSAAVEESFIAALDVTGNDLKKSVELVRSTLRQGPSEVHILNLKDIIATLKTKYGPKEDFQ